MIKKLLILVVMVIVVAGAGLYWYFDAVVTRGIEVIGSRVLGTEVSVASVSLSPLNGRGSISDLVIANPEGFRADSVFELGFVSVNLVPRSVFSEVVEIESLTIAQPVITYETRITTDNVRTLMANLPAPGETGSAQPGSASGKRVIIRELHILNPQLTLAAAGVSAPVQLPDITLHDIGSDNRAATVAQAVAVILAALRASIVEADLPGMELLREAIESSVQDAVERAGQTLDSTVENLGERLRALGN